MKRAILALAIVLALVTNASAELGFTRVSATSAGASTVNINAGTLLIINDGASVIYVRVFWEGETVAAATTLSAEIKSGEGLSFSKSLSVKAVSIISASSSTVRLIYW
jgi:uncharacterized membrane protein YtjA (UPF0391 family)